MDPHLKKVKLTNYSFSFLTEEKTKTVNGNNNSILLPLVEGQSCMLFAEIVLFL